jgi:hypothetical protein
MVSFHCEHCGRPMTASRALIGKWIRCPGCLRVFEVVADCAAGRRPFKAAPERLKSVYLTVATSGHEN